MNDPYVYPGTDILVNHFDIRDEARLGRVERLVTVDAMVQVMRSPPTGDVFDLSALTAIHRTLFQDIYPFAGEVRTIEISKPEEVLSGRSVRYGHPADIGATAQAAIATLGGVDYDNLSGSQGWQVFAEGIATLWRAHCFREGNTRAVLLFADLLLRSRGCQIDFSLMSRAPSDTRDELVRASEGYGRGLAELFREARASFLSRNHEIFGFMSADAAKTLADVGGGRDIPARTAAPGEAVRGAVLFEANGQIAIQTSKGLVAVPASSFGLAPQVGQRVALVADTAAPDGAPIIDYRLQRRIRNAILYAPEDIAVPDDPGGILSFRFGDPDVASAASKHPDLVGRIAAQVLQSHDPAAWHDWMSGRHSSQPSFSP